MTGSGDVAYRTGGGNNDWVAFDTKATFRGGGDGKVKSELDRRPGSTRSSSRDSRRQGRQRDTPTSPVSGSRSVATWMKRPIDSDASWLPVPPPQARDVDARDDDDQRSRAGSSAVTPKRAGTLSNGRPPVGSPVSRSSVQSRNRTPMQAGDNPASSSSVSSSSFERPVSQTGGRTQGRSSPKSSPRGRSITARNSTPTASSAVKGQSRGRSTSRTRVAAERDPSATRINVTSPSRGRSNSRPPLTRSNYKGRSDSKTPPLTRPRSVSRTRVQQTPPRPNSSSNRVGSASSIGPGIQHPRNGPNGMRLSNRDDASVRTLDANIGRNISFGTTRGRSASPSPRREGGIMEKLFGDNRPATDVKSTSALVPPLRSEHIHPRILLSATVYHNTATNLWIATINTNQKGVATNPVTASKYLKAFSFASEREARESAIANAPPKMISFASSPTCFLCNGKFAMFRRACHCRNCGVCICGSCAVIWSSKMLPETYNLKNESNVKVCKSCIYLSEAFKKALLQGDYEQAVAIYGTGNVNLRSPFPPLNGEKKGELMYPIHSAVDGGNISIVRWLIEEHFCPIKTVEKSNSKLMKKRVSNADSPILTSKGRSVLSIAMNGLKVDIIRYLVIEKGVSVYEVKDLKISLRALEAVLLAFPQQSGGLLHSNEIAVPRWDNDQYSDCDESNVCSSLGEDESLMPPDESCSLVL